MLTELVKHKYLGSINNILFVLQDVILKKPVKPMTVADIKKYCSDRTLNLVYEIDGILALLEFVEIITRSHNSIKLNKGVSQTWAETLNNIVLAKTITEKVLIKLRDESRLDDFISLERIRFDPTLNQISIHNSSIPLQYSSIKNLLINLGYFKVNSEYPSILLINESLQNYFETSIIPWLINEREKSALSRGHNGFSLEKLLELQELKNQYGAQAEEYVLEFERSRLKNHPSLSLIRRISNFDVSAGYDIVSFENDESKSFDRFIEVKSFSKYPEFYWSKNEIRTAEIRQKGYFLYLVDREQMEMNNYQPVIIQDPYKNVFDNPNYWQKEPQNWLVKPFANSYTTTSPKEINVFVSYSRANKAFVKELVDELEAKGYKTWWDYTNIKGGQDWQQEIQKGIINCDYFLVVLTPESVVSEWVGNEITLAAQKRKIIIPLKLEECETPIAIIKKQHIEFKKQAYKAALKELIELLNIGDRNMLSA